ncbi:hypothetical protein LINGRAHAP2_LOCUS32091 [Linum grandiflorum]
MTNFLLERNVDGDTLPLRMSASHAQVLSRIPVIYFVIVTSLTWLGDAY